MKTLSLTLCLAVSVLALSACETASAVDNSRADHAFNEKMAK